MKRVDRHMTNKRWTLRQIKWAFHIGMKLALGDIRYFAKHFSHNFTFGFRYTISAIKSERHGRKRTKMNVESGHLWRDYEDRVPETYEGDTRDHKHPPSTDF